MTTGLHALVVGGSLAGLRSAEQLRSAGHLGPITVVGAESHLPYNRPPLSKDVLSCPDRTDAAELAARLAFRRRSSTADVNFRLGDPVVRSDLHGRTVRTESGEDLSYDGLVVATGLRPRRLAVPGPTRGRHVLRTVEDCQGLREDLVDADPCPVVVVGAGFVGCEVAATLSSLGHHVTVVEPAGAPMERVVGPELARAVQRHHEAAGITFRIGTGVTAFEGTDRVTGVFLSTGELLPAEVVVEAVGSACNVEWLEGNGLDLSDGVLVDNQLRVVGASGVVAVGDVARFPNPLFDDVARRVEHWSIPTDTAKRAALSLTATFGLTPADDTHFAPVPSFWSDQLDLRLQSFGSPSLADEIRLVEGELHRLTDGVLTTYHREGRHVGTLAINLSPARQRELRAQFDELVPVA